MIEKNYYSLFALKTLSHEVNTYSQEEYHVLFTLILIKLVNIMIF